MLKLDRIDTPAGGEHATVYLVFELSNSRWQLGVLLPGSEKLSQYSIAGGDLTELASRLARCRSEAARGGKPVQVMSCYEAGLDGHWLHRWLTDQGVISYEVDPSSIEVSRRARRAKTDRIDLEKLMRTFLAYLRGEPRVCSMVHVPSVEDEDRKRRTRARERLLKERVSHGNRIKGLLHGQGVREAQPLKPGFLASIDEMRTGDGRMLAPWLKEEIVREHERLCFVAKQLNALDVANKAARLGRGQDTATHRAQEHRSDRRARAGQRGILSLVQQSPSGRQLFRACGHALRQRREPPRAGHQQGRQPACAQACDRARLAVAAASAGQRSQPLVP
jgi:transposase